MKQYRYFVSYAVDGNTAPPGVELSFSGRGRSSAIANKVVTMSNSISTEEDIRSVEGSIADGLVGCMAYAYVQIISYQLIGEFESEQKTI